VPLLLVACAPFAPAASWRHGFRLFGPARSSHGPPAFPPVRMSNAAECFSGPRPFSLWRPNPRAPCCCCARPSGLPRGLVPLLVVVLVCCFGWLAGLPLLVRLLASRCLWLRPGGGLPRAAGLLLPVLLALLGLSLSLRGWPCPSPLLVVPLWWLLPWLRGVVRRLAARLVGAGVPPALRRSSARGVGFSVSLRLLLVLVWRLPPCFRR